MSNFKKSGCQESSNNFSKLSENIQNLMAAREPLFLSKKIISAKGIELE